MNDNYKYYTQMERYEIININDGEKFNNLSSNDIVVDEEGYLRLLILSGAKNKFALWGNSDFIEVPWEYVKKIGTRTIIIDFEEQEMKKTKL